MKKCFSLLCAGALVAAFVATAFAAEPQYKQEYKLSTMVGESMTQGKALARFVKQVKEKTGGKVNIKVYWSGQLMSGKQTSELMIMRRNVADFSFSSFINWDAQLPIGNLFLLPWFISSKPDKWKALDAIEDGQAGKMIIKEISDKFHLTVLAWGEEGARELTNNIRPITKPDDLKDMKVRVVGSPLFVDIFRALGSNPVNINFGDMLTALQQGAIDGEENPWGTILGYRIHEFQKYITEWSYNMDPLIFTCHNDVWKTFPDDVKKIIVDAAFENGLYSKQLLRLNLDDGTAKKWLTEHNMMPTDPKDIDPHEFVKKSGVQVTILTRDQVKLFRDKMNSVYEKWIPKIGKELVEAAQKDMDSAKY